MAFGWGISIKAFFKPFRGNFKGKAYNSPKPGPVHFANATCCQDWGPFISVTLEEWIACVKGATLDDIEDLHRIDLVQVGKERQDILKTETSRDPIVRELSQIIKSGWPESITELPTDDDDDDDITV